MYTDTRHQEILLMTNTSFSSREWCIKNETAEQKRLSKKEQLIQACWNGLAPKMLPECFDFTYDKSMILWGINDANVFIDLEFGDFVQVIEKVFSVNPYVFMQVQAYN
jgi:muramidase (phage lysozyme)